MPRTRLCPPSGRPSTRRTPTTTIHTMCQEMRDPQLPSISRSVIDTLMIQYLLNKFHKATIKHPGSRVAVSVSKYSYPLSASALSESSCSMSQRMRIVRQDCQRVRIVRNRNRTGNPTGKPNKWFILVRSSSFGLVRSRQRHWEHGECPWLYQN